MADKKEGIASNIQQLMDGLESGEVKKLKLADEFSFQCEHCGKCCMGDLTNMLNPYDIWEIMRTGVLEGPPYNIKTTEDLYAEEGPMVLTLGRDSRAPLVFIKTRLLPTDDGESVSMCPFLLRLPNTEDKGLQAKLLNDEAGCLADSVPWDTVDFSKPVLGPQGDVMTICALQQAKPSICRAYPIGRTRKTEIQKAGEEGERKVEDDYLLVPVTCGSKDTTQTVDEWLRRTGMHERHKYTDSYFALLGYLMDHKEFFNDDHMTAIGQALYNFDALGLRENKDLTYENIIEGAKAHAEELLSAKGEDDVN